MKALAIFLIFLLLIPSAGFVSGEPKIPDWVKNIFIWYGEEQISEEELLSAIKYLVEIEIIPISNYDTIEDEGDFIADYIPAKTSKYKEIESVWKELKMGEGIARNLNDELKLPWDIKITHAECGGINAFYIPSTHEIMMCYEMLEYLMEFYTATAASQYDIDNVGRYASGAYMFILFHELGHALVHAYDLPITGKEENAVDQLATLTMLNLPGGIGADSIQYASFFFFVKGAQAASVNELKFWDEHNLDLQRFYDIMCLKYGKDVIEKNKFANKGPLPKERADKCPAEYEKIVDSWDTLLNPFFKYRSLVR